MANYGFEPAIHDDWVALVKRAETRGHSLEPAHVWILSQVLRRPIICYGVQRSDWMGVTGGGQPAFFRGIYLPLMWEPSDCDPSPLTIAYTPGHFTALVPELEALEEQGEGRD